MRRCRPAFSDRWFKHHSNLAMPLVNLRGREGEDAVQSLLLLAAGSLASAEAASRGYRGGEWALFGWEEEGQIVGCAGLSHHGDFAVELHSVAVAPGWRGRGVGRSLVDAAAASANARRLVAETDLDGVGFYRACGFHVEVVSTKGGHSRFRCVRAFGPISQTSDA